MPLFSPTKRKNALEELWKLCRCLMASLVGVSHQIMRVESVPLCQPQKSDSHWLRHAGKKICVAGWMVRLAGSTFVWTWWNWIGTPLGDIGHNTLMVPKEIDSKKVRHWFLSQDNLLVRQKQELSLLTQRASKTPSAHVPCLALNTVVHSDTVRCR